MILSERHRNFVKLFLEGASQREAFGSAFDEPDPMVCSRKACTLMRNPFIREEIVRLQAEIDKKWLLSREEKRAILGKLVVDDETPLKERIKALEVDNAMAGHNAPSEVKINGVADLLAQIRSEANPE